MPLRSDLISVSCLWSTSFMAPKKSTTSSSKRSNTSKRAWVYDSTPDSTKPTILPHPKRLSVTTRKLVVDRENLKIIVEKDFHELGFETLLHIFGDYHPNLVCEFYTNMLYKMGASASILGIRDEGNTGTVDSNRKTFNKDSDWSYEATCDRLEIRPRPFDRRRILHGDDFSQLLPQINKTIKIGIRESSSQLVDDESEDDESNDDGSYGHPFIKQLSEFPTLKDSSEEEEDEEHGVKCYSRSLFLLWLLVAKTVLTRANAKDNISYNTKFCRFGLEVIALVVIKCESLWDQP
ncbi:hypothetical protein M9H77_07309 [Catharanthus roseus]|uniref:Uncharacterized protein n=1 Tax=Catharanthus roseus TaxID=4058 RepID=A0ACC0BUR2_CATRO|nr:hypothetical protein M9H77_07309 [Catharanthus roseus]